MSEELTQFDTLIIGAGPAGLSVIAEILYHECGTAAILEKGETHNQTIHQYYPEDKRVDAAYLGQEAVCAGILCFRDTTKKNFLWNAETLLRKFHPKIFYNTTVDSIKKVGDSFYVSTTDLKTYQARYVVVAIGRMGKPNRPDFFSSIPSKAKTHTHFDTRKIPSVRKNILVVGGGNTAVEFALSLSTNHTVTLSYRQGTFTRLNPMNLHLLEADEKKGTLRVLRNSQLKGITEDENGKPVIEFMDTTKEVFDEVVFGIGGSSPTAFLNNAGIQLDAKGLPVLSQELESSVPGLFVAGELSVPPGKGSIIASFNSGKRIVDAILTREKKLRKPELNIVR